MKIVLIADAWQPLTGGGQKLFWELSSRLAKDHSCQITIITRALRYENKVYIENETYYNDRLKIVRFGPALPFFNLFGRLWFIFQSWFYCLKFNPDIFLASTWLPAISLQLIKLFKKTPVVLAVIGFGARNKFSNFLQQFISQKLNFNLLITDDWNFYKNSKKLIKFIPNGAEIPHFAKATWGKWETFTFLTIARNEPRKGIPILLEALKIVQNEFPQVKLHLFGPGFNIISQSDLDNEFFKANCLVLPSLWEGHPLVLFEAWAHQLPVIATNVGSVSKFVNSDNGYLVPPRDVQSLARAMKLAIKNPSLPVMGKNGYQLVFQNYSWSKTVTEYFTALKKVTSRKKDTP